MTGNESVVQRATGVALVTLNISVTVDPLYHPTLKFISKLSETTDIFLGCYMLVLSLLTVVLNLIVLVTVSRMSRTLNALELYVVNLSVVDLCPAVLEYPLTSYSAFSHGWAFGDLGCELCAAVVYFFGIASISTVTMMSVMRYIKTCHNKYDQTITRRFIGVSLIPIYLNSLLWSVAPLLGWGAYGPEPHGNACTLDWRRLSLSYIICMFAFIYILPVGLIGFSYGRMIFAVRKAQSQTTVVRNRMDLYLAKLTIGMALLFIIAWTPYAILAFYYIIADYHDVPLVISTAVPYLTKSTTLYNPIVYFLAVKRFRKEVKAIFKCCRFKAKTHVDECGGTVQTKLTSLDKRQTVEFNWDTTSRYVEQYELKASLKRTPISLPELGDDSKVALLKDKPTINQNNNI